MLKILMSIAMLAGGTTVVMPVLETPALFDDEAGGNADVDDPAIWVNHANKANSRVLVTAKNGGLYVYDLRGRQTQHFPTPEDGRFNNVDLIDDLAVVTDRGNDKLRFYRIGGDGTLTDVTAANTPLAFNSSAEEVQEQKTAYGLATFQSGGHSYAVASRRHTPELGLFKIIKSGNAFTYAKVDSLTLPSTFRLRNGSKWTPCLEPGEGPQAEGMTVDPTLGTLYVAQEDVALWRLSVHAGRFTSRPQIVEKVREFGVPATFDPESEECVYDWAADPHEGGRIAADVEGLTILRTGLVSGTLIVSSQGDNTFYTYSRLTNRPLGHFAVGGEDGSQECDGADVTATALPGFPGGLLVVQDGHAAPEDGSRDARNVKFVDAGFLR